MPLKWLFLVAVSLLGSLPLPAEGARRALLIGINDYSASGIASLRSGSPPHGRDWPPLNGAVNDVRTLKEMLVLLYGFRAEDIATLTDQEATRDAILHTIESRLVAPSGKDDLVFFYYAGHGSQVANSQSDEPDKLDESLVPADSLRGARDIRDKELRVLFNRILDRGAQLTILLDSCHSASGARGLPTGARPRGLKPDLRDVSDPVRRIPRPENRGALVLAAAQDDATAWETRDAQGVFHGTFSWAWIRSLRDAAAGEAAMTTFLRTQSRMRAEQPFQDPVIAGTSDVRLRPFLATRTDRRDQRTVVAVSRVRNDGTVVVQGGWANGLSIGNELRTVSTPQVRMTVTAIRGLGQCEARISGAARNGLRPGTLVEVTGWAAPPPAALRVWIPRFAGSADTIAAIARSMAEHAARRHVRWVTNPLDRSPDCVLRYGATGWELLAPEKAVEHLGGDSSAIQAIDNLSPNRSLFVQLPAPAALIAALPIGPRSSHQEVTPLDEADGADYILTGRYAGQHLTYAWVRPLVSPADRLKSALPLRSEWTDPRKTVQVRDAVLRLRAIRAWQLLQSPPESRFPYHLDLRRSPDDELPKESVVVGGEHYRLVLRAGSAMLPATVTPRYLYVFTIDSFGRSTLLFPHSGSVENRYPVDGPQPELELAASAFEIEPPYGVDTYVLLSTDEPLPNPWILEGEGVRTRDVGSPTPLEQLLLQTATGVRGARIVTSSTWSIERFLYESKPKG